MPKISEEGKKILKKWQDIGVKFSAYGLQKKCVFLQVDSETYSILEQPVPEWATLGDLENMQSNGLKFKVEDVIRGALSIPAQSIPKELLEMEEPKKEILIHHIPERKLWLAQREAGTNEQWQWRDENGRWVSYALHQEPPWINGHEYRVKPKMVKRYMAMSRSLSGGCQVFSSISEPNETKEEFAIRIQTNFETIIGNIEERDVEV